MIVNKNKLNKENKKGTKMEKKIYTLRGSGDGIIGAYSNAKLALESAINYATSFGRKLVEKETALYSELCKTGYVVVEGREDESDSNADVEIIRLIMKYKIDKD